MCFPEDFFVTCDQVDAGWPMHWFDGFGTSKFFYVAGLREHIHRTQGILSPTDVASLLIEHKAEIFSADPDFTSNEGLIEKDPVTGEFAGTFNALVPVEWLAAIYQRDSDQIDYFDCLVDGRFYNLTVANIRDAYYGKSVTFSAALLVYLAAKISAKKRDAEECNIQIRLAAFWISNFDAVYKELTFAQKMRLCEHTGQVHHGGHEVFSQMASGLPVTKPLASRTAAFLNKLFEGELPPLQVNPYLMRTDIPVAKGKRPAKEQAFLTFRELDRSQ